MFNGTKSISFKVLIIIFFILGSLFTQQASAKNIFLRGSGERDGEGRGLVDRGQDRAGLQGQNQSLGWKGDGGQGHGH